MIDATEARAIAKSAEAKIDEAARERIRQAAAGGKLETLQERFQLRSRFSRPGLSHIPLVQDPATSLVASLPAPPRRPRNVTRKRVAKKLKVTETTSQEVSRLE